MKKAVTLAFVAALSLCAFARLGGPGHRPGFGGGHHHHHHRSHHRGEIAAGIIGAGIIGGVISHALNPRPVVVTPAPTVVTPAPVVVTPAPVVVAPAPVVVQQPVYQTQNVWVEGRYVDQVQANGTVVRVWQPGHYEQRTIQVQ